MVHVSVARCCALFIVVLSMLCLLPGPASAQEPRPEVDETQADDSDEFRRHAKLS